MSKDSEIKSIDDFMAEVASMYNHHMTDTEALFWQSEIFLVYSEKEILAAFKYYMENHESRRFMPRYADIKEILQGQDSDNIFNLARLVHKYGSYRAPQAGECSDAMLKAIELLGGWQRVCREMPDTLHGGYELSQYEKKFTQALEIGKKRVNFHNEKAKQIQGRAQNLLEKESKDRSLLKNDLKTIEQKGKLTAEQVVKMTKQMLFLTPQI